MLIATISGLVFALLNFIFLLTFVVYYNASNIQKEALCYALSIASSVGCVSCFISILILFGENV
jgi:hypothetical protein